MSISRDNVFLGDLLVASYVSNPGTPGWQYYFSDHLGSPRVVTNGAGTVVETRKYWPYGEPVSTETSTQVHRFVAMERDDEATQYYAHARMLDFALSRFRSPDLAPGNAFVPASWNRYAYGLGSPLVFTDPDGLTIRLCDLSDEQREKLLSDLADFTGNVYAMDSNGNLALVQQGAEASPTATEFINAAIESTTVYNVVAANDSRVGFGETDPRGTDIKLDFSDFKDIKFGKVDPRAFNIGATFVHELFHQWTGAADADDGKGTGPTVSFVNVIQTERGMPTRSPEYVAHKNFWGTRILINFQNVPDHNPARIYWVKAKLSPMPR